MHRKEFLKSLALLTGTALTADAFAGLTPLIQVSPYKKGISYYMIKEELSVLDKFKLVKDLGFDGIEFNTPLEVPMKEILSARDKTGVAIPSTVNKDHWNKPLSDPNPENRKFIVESIGRSLQESKEMGADTVLVVPGVVSEQVSYKTAFANALESVRKLIPYAEKTGVRIGLENVWNNFILSPMEALAFLDAIDHPMVGWYFDLGNVLRYGWPEHWLEVLGERIFKLHVKEFSRKIMNEEGMRKGFSVELGQGDVNWPVVMKAVQTSGYKGEYLTLELGGGDRTYLEKVSRQLDIILLN
ncbi:sugar phosphate isomerase/epimerase family protein [Sphingobacterium lactis]|uniref:sugar phosphate isomerase/epimerase family protein n=1 Tax=Sphingobacterium lactis TaxID=797291 RepID=UPI003EC72400